MAVHNWGAVGHTCNFNMCDPVQDDSGLETLNNYLPKGMEPLCTVQPYHGPLTFLCYDQQRGRQGSMFVISEMLLRRAGDF